MLSCCPWATTLATVLNIAFSNFVERLIMVSALDTHQILSKILVVFRSCHIYSFSLLIEL